MVAVKKMLKTCGARHAEEADENSQDDPNLSLP